MLYIIVPMHNINFYYFLITIIYNLLDPIFKLNLNFSTWFYFNDIIESYAKDGVRILTE